MFLVAAFIEKIILCCRYHWYFPGKGDNALAWLKSDYFLSYMDYVDVSVYNEIRSAFDAMVVELKWPYDPERSVH